MIELKDWEHSPQETKGTYFFLDNFTLQTVFKNFLK